MIVYDSVVVNSSTSFVLNFTVAVDSACGFVVYASSVSRALAGGAPNIERVDLLVKTIARQQGMQSDAVDESVALVDSWLALNRQAA